MKPKLALALTFLVGVLVGAVVLNFARPQVGRYAFEVSRDSTGAPWRLDTATGEIAVFMGTGWIAGDNKNITTGKK